MNHTRTMLTKTILKPLNTDSKAGWKIELLRVVSLVGRKVEQRRLHFKPHEDGDSQRWLAFNGWESHRFANWFAQVTLISFEEWMRYRRFSQMILKLTGNLEHRNSFNSKNFQISAIFPHVFRFSSYCCHNSKSFIVWPIVSRLDRAILFFSLNESLVE